MIRDVFWKAPHGVWIGDQIRDMEISQQST